MPRESQCPTDYTSTMAPSETHPYRAQGVCVPVHSSHKVGRRVRASTSEILTRAVVRMRRRHLSCVELVKRGREALRVLNPIGMRRWG